MFTMEVWGELIVQVLSIVILALVGMATQALFTYLKNKGVIEQILAKEELAMIAVNFVEQVYQGFSGPQKFDAAVGWLADRMNQVGLKTNPEELAGLIEAAVLEMQSNWYEVIADYEPDDAA